MLSSTMFGGVSCMPKAWRSIDSTMIVRVNDVIAITIAGSSASTVSSRTMRSGWASDAPPARSSGEYRPLAAAARCSGPRRRPRRRSVAVQRFMAANASWFCTENDHRSAAAALGDEDAFPVDLHQVNASCGTQVARSMTRNAPPASGAPERRGRKRRSMTRWRNAQRGDDHESDDRPADTCGSDRRRHPA